MAKMKQKQLGTTAIPISLLGMGCWAIGGPFYLDGKEDGWGPVDDAVSIEAIHTAIDHGMTFFDTSDAYGTGHSEEVLGRALKHCRKDVTIATKFGFTHDREQRAITGTNLEPSYIREACELSLQRLQTDYIDLYQLHVWSIPLEQIDAVIEALEGLQSDGLIRAYGWSTGDPQCAAYFAEHSNAQAFQHPANVFGYEPAILELCEKHRMTSINNGPLAMGLLSGKYTAQSEFAKSEVRGSDHAWLKYFQDGKPVRAFMDQLNAIREILTSDGRTLAQGALSWLWSLSDTNVPIPGIRTPAQAIENAKAMEYGPLTAQQFQEISRMLASATVK